jgi:hypothetical protein
VAEILSAEDEKDVFYLDWREKEGGRGGRREKKEGKEEERKKRRRREEEGNREGRKEGREEGRGERKKTPFDCALFILAFLLACISCT